MPYSYWNTEFDLFYNPKNGIDIDGAWIDMNEPSSVSNQVVKYSSFAHISHFSSVIIRARIRSNRPENKIYPQRALLSHLHLMPQSLVARTFTKGTNRSITAKTTSRIRHIIYKTMRALAHCRIAQHT